MAPANSLLCASKCMHRCWSPMHMAMVSVWHTMHLIEREIAMDRRNFVTISNRLVVQWYIHVHFSLVVRQQHGTGKQINTTSAPWLSNFNSIDYVMLNNCNRQYNVIDVLFFVDCFSLFLILRLTHNSHSCWYTTHRRPTFVHHFFPFFFSLLSRKLINYIPTTTTKTEKM